MFVCFFGGEEEPFGRVQSNQSYQPVRGNSTKKESQEEPPKLCMTLLRSLVGCFCHTCMGRLKASGLRTELLPTTDRTEFRI